ncbi:MAG: exopolyphosphatase [Desulfuromonadales bacterium]|nr:exopolyphosphatase [Desulfuromonadales bacterium]
MSIRRVAAIDFGTNTARLLVADRHPNGSFEYVRIEREIVRMGGGFDRVTGLSAEAIQRGSSCLGRFAEIMESYGVSNPRAVATSAIRDAANGREFVEAIQRQTGIRLAVIDGHQEGALTLAGVIAGLAERRDNLMVFDVGGGSTEYTLSHGGSAEFIKSLPLGVVRLTEGKGTPAEMSEKICRELDQLTRDITRSNSAVTPENTVLIGTAGTATTLAAISQQMATYDYRKVHSSVLGIDEIRRIYSLLLPLSLEERVAIPGLEKGREDLIIAGTLITLHTMERFGFNRFTVSDFGLLEGLIVVDELPV